MTPDVMKELLKAAFLAGFGVSREGFNGECAYDHLAPGYLSLDELCEQSVEAIMQGKELPDFDPDDRRR
jgi:hypothetical protein